MAKRLQEASSWAREFRANRGITKRDPTLNRVVNLVIEGDSRPLITLSVREDNLVQQSTYFKNLFLDKSGSSEFSPRCRLSYSKSVLLRFAKWIDHPRAPRTYAPANYSREFWTKNAVPMWFLAYEIESGNLERFALAHFIQNCALMQFGPWTMIEQKAAWESSLRRFSDHWIAWNLSLAGSGINEYMGLRAAHLAIEVTDQTRDPRIFDLDHWYSPCGGHINPFCEHDPVHRKENVEQQRQTKQPTPISSEAVSEEEYERTINQKRALRESR